MSFSAQGRPRNPRELRAAEAGHKDPRAERKFDREGGILAFPMSQVQDRLGISRSKAYEEIAAGRLIARKCGSRTLITYASAQAWLTSLPALAA